MAQKLSFCYAYHPMESTSQSADEVQALRAKAIEEIRKSYPPILTTALVAELMHCTIGDVRDKVHRGELPAVRWGQQFRFFREEVLAALEEVLEGEERIAGD
jgi:excisionase family DNA binding protein